MTIKELYEWALSKGFENYPVKIDKSNRVEDIKEAEIVTKDSIFNGIFYTVDTETVILK